MADLVFGPPSWIRWPSSSRSKGDVFLNQVGARVEPVNTTGWLGTVLVLASQEVQRHGPCGSACPQGGGQLLVGEAGGITSIRAGVAIRGCNPGPYPRISSAPPSMAWARVRWVVLHALSRVIVMQPRAIELMKNTIQHALRPTRYRQWR